MARIFIRYENVSSGRVIARDSNGNVHGNPQGYSSIAMLHRYVSRLMRDVHGSTGGDGHSLPEGYDYGYRVPDAAAPACPAECPHMPPTSKPASPLPAPKATITFRSAVAHSVFASMAEGMGENARDDDETERADALFRLASIEVETDDGGTAFIAEADYSLALAVVENAESNGPGGHIDGPAATMAEEDGEDRCYLLTGEVVVSLCEPVRINSEYARVPETIDLRQALRLAIHALGHARDVPHGEAAQAHDWLIELYQQRGCDHLGEGYDTLVECCSVFIRG